MFNSNFFNFFKYKLNYIVLLSKYSINFKGMKMKKSDVLEQLRLAKTAHIRWVQRAKLLISGFAIEEDAIPVNCTDCHFGQWFYSDGQVLSGMSTNPIECMKKIEELHFKLHHEYLSIFKIYYVVRKNSFLNNFFNFDTRRNPNDAEKELAKNYYENMDKISNSLLNEIGLLERRIIAISDKVIEELI